uniref:Uncharacterized protein n=1 Tax=Lactuca sativa TaxID=4236 RepID=A0A9R1WMF6_LACSA|nr:hypothetical protein LSAT_V11C100018580 [Lactuca sativa]
MNKKNHRHLKPPQIPLQRLSFPYNLFSDQLKRAASDLKQIIVSETWGNTGKHLNDYTLYIGALDITMMVFKAYKVTHNKKNLDLFKDILKACDSASFGFSCIPVTFICGQVGVSALDVIVAKQSKNGHLFNRYLTRFKKIKLPKNLPNELFFGRAGYLWACLFIKKNLDENIISSTHMRKIKDEIIKAGRNMSTSECPLMFEWYGKRYWGGAHGFAWIMNVLMDMELTEDESKDVFGSDEFLKASIDVGEVVWKRGLLKKVGIYHGISGNAYIFL